MIFIYHCVNRLACLNAFPQKAHSEPPDAREPQDFIIFDSQLYYRLALGILFILPFEMLKVYTLSKNLFE
ncbi:hypothetical protein SDC9_210453 [bioreactor metagenome]|uniref:Uncharacterized protein n=1 Tax=bioreactor metagenome TaxID=1076179 RepID=A0A645JHX5_9ZZZZ